MYQVFIYDNGLDEEFEYSFSLVQWPVVPPSEGSCQYLAVYQCDGRAYVRWSTNSTGFALFSAPTLEPFTYAASYSYTNCQGPFIFPNGATIASPNWTPVTNAPYVIADHFHVDEGVPSGMKFYRLIDLQRPHGQ